jgi:predicted MPP superfamily phosphohydrolase
MVSFISVIVVLALSLAALSWIIAFIFLFIEQQQEKQVADQITKVEASLKRLALVEQNYKAVYNKTLSVSTIFTAQEEMLKNISDVKGTVVPNMSFDSFSIDTAKVSMNLTTPNYKSMALYLDNAEDENGTQKIIKNLSLTGLSIDKINGYQTKVEGTVGNETPAKQ